MAGTGNGLDDRNRENTEKNVRRRLDFGCENKTNNEQTNTASEAISIKNVEEDRLKAMEKWNFDFKNEVPLEGDWEWEKVEYNRTVRNLEITLKEDDGRKENRHV